MKLKVTPNELFDVMETSIKEDIKNATGKEVKKIERGFKYSKKSVQRKNTNISVMIKEYVYGQSYKTSFSTVADKVDISYLVQDTKDGSCLVTYNENYTYTNGKEPNKLSKKMMDSKSEKAMKKTFKEIENYIIKERSK